MIGQRELDYVVKAVKSGWVSSKGEFIEKFEKSFATYLGAAHGVATSSGTTALHLALASLGIGQGSEVIIPSFTMIATANAVTYTGARPVLVDSEPETWNINPNKIKEKITARTKAIMVVHTYGHPADMDPVIETARQHGLYVVEDAAEAHGAEYKHRKAGNLGDVACFSFYANKIVTTGEGGMVVSNREDIARMAALLRDQAFEGGRRFLHRYVGFNYRITNLQAALGVAQLERIDELVEARRRNAQTYNRLLRKLDGVDLPPEASWAKNVYWMYSIRLNQKARLSRDVLGATLLERFGIDTRPFFVPIHRQPVYNPLFVGERYPIAEELSETGVNLPSSGGLTPDVISYVCDSVIAACRGK